MKRHPYHEQLRCSDQSTIEILYLVDPRMVNTFLLTRYATSTYCSSCVYGIPTYLLPLINSEVDLANCPPPPTSRLSRSLHMKFTWNCHIDTSCIFVRAKVYVYSHSLDDSLIISFSYSKYSETYPKDYLYPEITCLYIQHVLCPNCVLYNAIRPACRCTSVQRSRPLFSGPYVLAVCCCMIVKYKECQWPHGILTRLKVARFSSNSCPKN